MSIHPLINFESDRPSRRPQVGRRVRDILASEHNEQLVETLALAALEAEQDAERVRTVLSQALALLHDYNRIIDGQRNTIRTLNERLQARGSTRPLTPAA